MKEKPVVMVHGIGDTGIVFDSMRSRLEKENYPVLTIDLTPNLGVADLRDLAQQLKIFIDHNIHENESITLLGFSMGGLVTRYYLQRLEGLKKVEKYISISSPNNGTNLAYTLPLKGVKQMRPYSQFLSDLNRDVKLQFKDFKSLFLWTPFDMMIIPAKSSLLGIGKEIKIPVLIHRWMLEDERVIETVVRFIQEG